MAIKVMKLPPNQGIRVFEMDVTHRGSFRTRLKDTIDTLLFTVDERQEILAEAPAVYHRNNAVMQSHEGTGQRMLLYFCLITLLNLVLLFLFKWFSGIIH